MHARIRDSLKLIKVVHSGNHCRPGPGAKEVAINETSDEAAVTVGAMVVELASLVAVGDALLILVKSRWAVIWTY